MKEIIYLVKTHTKLKQLNHILFFTKEYRHDRISNSGGTGVFYKNLSEKLVQLGYEVTVFGSCNKPCDFTENGIRFMFIKNYFKKNRIQELFRSLTGKFNFTKSLHFSCHFKERLYLVDELKLFLKKNNLNPDIIETHDWDGLFLYLDRINIPYVVRCHGSWNVLEKFGYNNMSLGKKYCEQQAFKKSKNHIVISKTSQKLNEEIYGLSEVKFIYNGIDTDFFNYLHQKPIDEIKNPKIFFIGNVTIEKGADVALKSWLIFKKKYPTSTLHFVGNFGDYKNTLLQSVEKTYKTEILFYGQQNKIELKNLIKEADIVLFPSKGENLSLAIIETMSMAKAVICSNIPSFQEIVTDGINGFIASDTNEFAEKLELVIEDAELKRKIEENARKTVKEKFDLNTLTTETLNYYEEIVNRN